MANDEPSIPPGRQFGSSEYYTHLLSTVPNPLHLREVASSPTTTPINQTASKKELRPASLCLKLCASGSHTENVRHPRFYFSDGNVIFSVSARPNQQRRLEMKLTKCARWYWYLGWHGVIQGAPLLLPARFPHIRLHVLAATPSRGRGRGRNR
jgi:hypothetical protein